MKTINMYKLSTRQLRDLCLFGEADLKIKAEEELETRESLSYNTPHFQEEMHLDFKNIAIIV